MRLSFGSPARQWILLGGGFKPLLIPHSIDARPWTSIEYPQTMFRDGVLNAPYLGGRCFAAAAPLPSRNRARPRTAVVLTTS
jgi:hypothetical protein